MEYDPITKRIWIDRATYRLPVGACAPAPLIMALYRHVDSSLTVTSERLKAELLCCARHENELQRVLNAVHDLPLLYEQRHLLVADMNSAFTYRDLTTASLAVLPIGTLLTPRSFARHCGHMVGRNALVSLCRKSLKTLLSNAETFLIRRGVTLRLVDTSSLARIVREFSVGGRMGNFSSCCFRFLVIFGHF